MSVFRAGLCAALASSLLACGDPTPTTVMDAPANITVRAGERIQDAIDKMPPGAASWIVAVEPGVYRESLAVDRNGVELRGLAKGAGLDEAMRPVLDGEGKRKDGVLASGAGFTMRGFAVRNYTGNGVMVTKTRGAKLLDLDIDKTGTYGLYPVEMEDVLVENCRVSGVADAGIYVGQSKNATVRKSKVFANVTGIEIENTVGALVEDNEATDNTAGILVFLLPKNVSKVGDKCTVQRNHSYANNHVNFAEPNATVAKVPRGLGIFVMAADNTVVRDNDLHDNESAGVAVVSLALLEPDPSKLDVEPNPDGTQLRQNKYTNNGKNPDKMVKDVAMRGGDVLWDLTGKGVCQDELDNVDFVVGTPARCP